MADPVSPDGLQQLQRPADVVGVVGQRVGHRFPHLDEGGEVHDRLHVGTGRSTRPAPPRR